MIKGFINYPAREAIVSLRVQGSGGREAEIEAVIDTGFNGSLMLPAALVEKLKLPFVSSASAALANGDQVFLDVFKATVLLDGKEHDSAVVKAEGGVLRLKMPQPTRGCIFKVRRQPPATHFADRTWHFELRNARGGTRTRTGFPAGF